MLAVLGICYIVIATAAPKILGLFSSNLSILFNATISHIFLAISFGSFGGIIGKSICSLLIYKLEYRLLMTTSFICSIFCLTLEFLNIIPMQLYTFYTLCILQGFFAGLIYSGILAYLGEYYSGDEYKKYLTIITCGLGLAGPLFGLLFIILDFYFIIRIILFCALLGSILSFIFFKKPKNNLMIKIQTNIAIRKESFSIKTGIKLLFQQKSIFLLSFSFACNLLGALLILNNTKRLLILLIHDNYTISIQSISIKFLSVLPLIGGGLFFFFKRTEKNYILISLLLLIFIIIYFIIPNVFLCFIILIIAYGVHLILIPVGSDVFLSHQKSNKAYYSYIIHTIRSVYTMILMKCLSFFNIGSFIKLILWIMILNFISLCSFLFGRKCLDISKNHKD